MMARVNAQTLCAYFSQSLSEIVETLNNAKSIKDLDLPRANLDFRSDLKGNRCQLLIGPIKRAARAAVKSAEYNAEIRSGIKPAQTSAGRKLSGVDYVLDWWGREPVLQHQYVHISNLQGLSQLLPLFSSLLSRSLVLSFTQN